MRLFVFEASTGGTILSKRQHVLGGSNHAHGSGLLQAQHLLMTTGRFVAFETKGETTIILPIGADIYFAQACKSRKQKSNFAYGFPVNQHQDPIYPVTPALLLRLYLYHLTATQSCNDCSHSFIPVVTTLCCSCS